MGRSGRRGHPPYPYSLSSRNLVPAIEDLAIVASALETIPCNLWASPRSFGSVLDPSLNWNSFTTACCHEGDEINTALLRRSPAYRCDICKTCDSTMAVGIHTWEENICESTEDKEWCILVLSRIISRKCLVGNSGCDAAQFSNVATPTND